jgi:hypothetical protein
LIFLESFSLLSYLAETVANSRQLPENFLVSGKDFLSASTIQGGIILPFCNQFAWRDEDYLCQRYRTK